MATKRATHARRIEYMPIDSIPDAARNPKGHDDALIAGSIGSHGMVDPIVLDERTGAIISGHGRKANLVALRDAGASMPDGIELVDGQWCAPVVRGWSSRDDVHALEVGITVNRGTERGGWNTRELIGALDDIKVAGGGELAATIGFTEADLQRMVREQTEIPPPITGDGGRGTPVTAPEYTKPGDVWHLGTHRLMCGDCRDADDVLVLLDGDVINLAFTSPPYAEQRDYDDESGFEPIPPDEYVAWFEPVQGNVREHLVDDGSWFVNIKPPGEGLDTHLYVFDLVTTHVRSWGWHFATEFCWERAGVPKAVSLRFKNAFEPVYQFSLGRWKIRPRNVIKASDIMIIPIGPGAGETSWKDAQGNVDLFARNEKRTTKQGLGVPGIPNAVMQGTSPDEAYEFVEGEGWAYPSNRLPTFSHTHDAVGHSAAFPVGLPQWFIRAFTDESDIVYDPFGGSGSTLIAAHNEGRHARTIELSRKYCDIICRRFQEHTGIVPIRNGEAISFIDDGKRITRARKRA